MKLNRPEIILQARLTSKRFPNKVLCNLLGKTVLEWCIEACEKSKIPFVIAIPSTTTNQGLESWIKNYGLLHKKDIRVFTGNEEDLTIRYYDCANHYNIDPIIRLCGDSPFVNPQDMIDVLELYKKRGFYQRINHVECFSFLEIEYAKNNNPFIASREHVCKYMAQTVDYPEDIKRLTEDWNEEGSPTMTAKKKFWKQL